MKKRYQILCKTPKGFRRLVTILLFPKFFKIAMRWRFRADAQYSLKPYLEKNCIFIHLPKTGGVSVTDALFGGLSGGHLPLWIMQAACLPSELKDCKRVTIVRDPVKRLFSAYRFLLAGGMNARDAAVGKEIAESCSDFSSFVFDWLSPRGVYAYVHFIPQSFFMHSLDDKKMDFIGEFENLEGDYHRLKIFLKFGDPLPRKNITKRNSSIQKNETSHFSSELVGRIKELYHEDYDRLNYN